MAVRDVIQASAGNAGDSKTYIEDVFSTYLYTGNGTSQTINNGIDLAGKGGMVWVKSRSSTTLNHAVVDTVRGAYNTLYTNTTGAASGLYATIGSFSSTGFNVTNSSDTGNTNELPTDYVSWTFRKAPKFFDVVTYTGDGTSNRTIPHDLGVVPGMIIVKDTVGTGQWMVWHKDKTGNGTTGPGLYLNQTTVYSADGSVFSATQESSSFTVAPIAGTTTLINRSGRTYVAYLFAHDTTTDGLIQCGSFTTDASGNSLDVNLGWEPQYILYKRTNGTGDWVILDTMRNWSNTSGSPIWPNLSSAEPTAWTTGYVPIYATGFKQTGLSTNSTYIYMAIRRGPMRTPTDGTKVFQPKKQLGASQYDVTFDSLPYVDLIINWKNINSGGTYNTPLWHDRLRGFPLDMRGVTNVNNPGLVSSSASAEVTGTSSSNYLSGVATNRAIWNGGWSGYYGSFEGFRRAPGFFDVVCYTGTSADPGSNIKHNLTIKPEMVIVKPRNTANSWSVWHSAVSAATGKFLVLNDTFGTYTGQSVFNNSTDLMSASTFSVGSNAATNGSGNTYVAYLFASCPGVSKVGSYTGNGSSQTINCGFTNGARFVLIKRTDSTGDWYVWDTARGIVANNDPHLSLNTTSAEVTTNDSVDPDASGFVVNQVAATNVNVNAATYIYLAIA